jgi:GntR family transcriptional regulator
VGKPPKAARHVYFGCRDGRRATAPDELGKAEQDQEADEHHPARLCCRAMISIERIVPPPAVADRLQIPADTASVLRRENVFWADDDPVQRVTTYAPWKLAEGSGLLAEEVGHPYGIHGIFEDQGHVMTRIREEVSARMPRPEERRDLRLPPGVPVLDVLHTSLDQQGQPYELTRFVMRADLTGLLYDVPVE